ncbi:MAG: LPS assembly lipoprotein LptE [Steroidobacteraceae bacterium]
MHAKRAVQIFGALAACLWLSACGFHLQGRQSLPARLATLAVDTSDRHSDFSAALRRSLAASGVKLVERAATDGAVLRILHDEVTERVLSVDARNIPTDYELLYEVEVSVHAGATELMAAETFNLSRIYSFDETKLLAKEREKDILLEAMARDMASLVLRRLSAL